MGWLARTCVVTGGTVLAVSAGLAGGAGPAAWARPAPGGAPGGSTWAATPPLRFEPVGRQGDGRPVFARRGGGPTGLPPSAIDRVYSLSPGTTAGAGQVIAIVDAYRDPRALADLNTFNAQYGFPALASCRSLSQPGACFAQDFPHGTPPVNSGWVAEQSLDIEWAHAMAPGAKILLVDAPNAGVGLYSAVGFANAHQATEVSMSWGGSETALETFLDSYFTHPGTRYTASAGDSGHGAEYPAASPDVVAVGGTTLNGCAGTGCAFRSETAWTGSGGGASANEPVPAFQSSYSGPVSGAATLTRLAGGMRGIPDVAFDANPATGVSIYDSTPFQGQSGWFTVGGTSVGAPAWAGILAAGAAAGKTALQGDAAIYGGGYQTNLRDITSGGNGSCGADCAAGPGYDLVTGLGSPLNYP